MFDVSKCPNNEEIYVITIDEKWRRRLIDLLRDYGYKESRKKLETVYAPKKKNTHTKPLPNAVAPSTADFSPTADFSRLQRIIRSAEQPPEQSSDYTIQNYFDSEDIDEDNGTN